MKTSELTARHTTRDVLKIAERIIDTARSTNDKRRFDDAISEANELKQVINDQLESGAYVSHARIDLLAAKCLMTTDIFNARYAQNKKHGWR